MFTEIAFLVGCAALSIVGAVLGLNAEALANRRAERLAARPHWRFGAILASWTASGANVWFIRTLGLALAVLAVGLFMVRLWVLAGAK